MFRHWTSLICGVAGLMTAFAAQAEDVVKITPLGGQEGEFCRLDRALIF
jgi:hypothetical protein